MSAANIDQSRLCNFLQHCVLFEEANFATLIDIAKHLELVKFAKGDPVVLENEISDHVYFVFSGSVEVVKTIKQLNQLSRLAVLKPGSQFSEFSVITRANKNASVFALEDCELLRISGDDFLVILQDHPDILQNLVRHIGRMHWHVQSSSLRVNYFHRDDIAPHQQIPRILPPNLWQKHGVLPVALNSYSLTVALKDTLRPEFANQMRAEHPNLMLYVSIISEADFAAVAKQLNTIYNSPLPAPAPPAPEAESAALASWLTKVSLFKELDVEQIPQLEALMKFQSFAPGEYLYRAGEVSEKLFILRSGQVDLFMPLEGMPNTAIRVSTRSGGHYLSHNSLLNNTPHLVSARAITPVSAAIIDKALFSRLLQSPQFTLPLARDLVFQFQAISNSTGFRFYDPKDGEEVAKLCSLLPRSIIMQYGIMPLRLNNNELTVGITNPESDSIYSVISRYLHDYRVNLEIIDHMQFNNWLNHYSAETIHTDFTRKNASASAARGNAVEILNKLIQDGFDNRASDIHIEPTNDGLVVRFRVDGVLREHGEKFATATGTEIISRLKVLCQMDVTIHHLPQDGQLKTIIGTNTYYARASTLPSKCGETVVLRLIRQKQSVPPLSTIVPDRRVVNLLRHVAQQKQGAFLVTGPTGSGKSTTLYSLLKELNRVEVNIVSVEDPVEMEIAGVRQVEVNEKVGLTFASALRSTLRQDPNVIMIGEIRDAESAKIAFDAAMTGHLVISTLHTNDSLGVVPRLLELGVARGTIASTLLGASAQRLMRAICNKCRIQRPITESELEILRAHLILNHEPTELAQGKGCEHCDHTGYRSRLPMMEIWRKTPTIQDMVLAGASLQEIEQALGTQGYETLRQFALKMVVNSLTTMDEVGRCLGGFQNAGVIKTGQAA